MTIFHYLTSLPQQILGQYWNLQACRFCGGTWKPSDDLRRRHPEKFFSDGRYIPPDKCPFCDRHHWDEDVWEWLERLGASDMLDPRIWKEHGKKKLVSTGSVAKVRKGGAMTRNKRTALFSLTYLKAMERCFDPYWGEGEGAKFIRQWAEYVTRVPQRYIRQEECGLEWANHKWAEEIRMRESFRADLWGTGDYLSKANSWPAPVSDSKSCLAGAITRHFPTSGPLEMLYLPPATFSRRRPEQGFKGRLAALPVIDDGSWPDRSMAMFVSYAVRFNQAVQKQTPGAVIELVGNTLARSMIVRPVARCEMDEVLERMAKTIVEAIT